MIIDKKNLIIKKFSKTKGIGRKTQKQSKIKAFNTHIIINLMCFFYEKIYTTLTRRGFFYWH